jgi:hypothetical protein
VVLRDEMTLPASEPHKPIMNDAHAQLGEKVRELLMLTSVIHALALFCFFDSTHM